MIHWIGLHLLTFHEIPLLVESKIQVAVIAWDSCYFPVAMIRNLCMNSTRYTVRKRTFLGCLLHFAASEPAKRLYVGFVLALSQWSLGWPQPRFGSGFDWWHSLAECNWQRGRSYLQPFLQSLSVYCFYSFEHRSKRKTEQLMIGGSFRSTHRRWDHFCMQSLSDAR